MDFDVTVFFGVITNKKSPYLTFEGESILDWLWELKKVQPDLFYFMPVKYIAGLWDSLFILNEVTF